MQTLVPPYSQLKSRVCGGKFINILSLVTIAACAALYGANRLIPAGGVFLDGYFNDILAGYVILAIVNLLLSLGCLKPLKAPLPCLALCLGCGLVWEFITPLYRPGSVSDLWDIAAYMSGAVIWCIIVDKANRKC